MTSLELYDVLPSLRASQALPTAIDASEAPGEGARRWLNVVVATIGIVLTAPVMLAIAVLIRLTSRGPILYRQPRVGIDRRSPSTAGGNHRRSLDYGGRPFTIYKFRTMQTSRDGGVREAWASPDDPRVTRLGRILRQYRLDELPQLFNVLRGDMNIVGPRPEQPRIFNDLRHRVHNYGVRQRVRPGITGWAQINHHYDQSIEDVRKKIALDLDYIARQSVIEDLKIMLLTAPTVVFKRGAW